MVSKLPYTELLFDDSLFIDKLSINEGLKLLLKSQAQAVKSIEKSIIDIENAVSQIVKRINKYKSCRLIYVGAGTSGRIGVQDGAELYPTFAWPLSRVSYIIAGGKKSLTEPIEGAEDDVTSAIQQFKEKKVTKSDVIIALAASGNTPFTLQVVKDARKIGAFTVVISNNLSGKLLLEGQCPIYLESGKEVLAGSTRLAAGTSQKICLNLITTMVMAKLGRVKLGRMNYLVANNKKLIERKFRINQLLNKL